MKKLFSILLAVMMLVGVTACDSKQAQNTTNGKSDIESADKKRNYPIKIKTYDYQRKPVELTFKKAPERVVAIDQNSIETLLALGLEDKIVMGAGLDIEVKPEFKKAFSKIKYSDNVPTKEEVIALKPDFILGWYSTFSEKRLGDIKFWNERGTNTYMSQNSGVIKPNTLQNEYDDILNIGKIFGVQGKAKAIVGNMKNEIEKAKCFVKNKKPVRAVILEVEKPGVYRIYGEDSIGGDVAKQVGANLVAKSNGTIGTEDLIKLNPDVIFTVYYGKEIEKDAALNGILKNKSFNSINAVKSKRVYPIMLPEVYSSGIRTLDGIKTIIKGLYPDLNQEK